MQKCEINYKNLIQLFFKHVILQYEYKYAKVIL